MGDLKVKCHSNEKVERKETKSVGEKEEMRRVKRARSPWRVIDSNKRLK